MDIKKIGFVCDSTLSVDVETQTKYDCLIAELSIYLNGVQISSNISNSELMELIKNKKRVTTSQPAPEQYLNCYKELLINQKKERVYVYTVSKNLSGSYNSANLAIKMLDEELQSKVFVYNTLSVSGGSRYYFDKTIEYIEKGLSEKEILEKLDYSREHSYLMFVVDNLDTIYINGRLGKVRYMIASVLRLKPILKYQIGELDTVSRGQIGIDRTLKFMVNKIQNDIEKYSDKKVSLSIAYVDDEKNSNKLYDLLVENIDKKVEIKKIGEISQIISSHIGPGGIGIFVAFE